MKKVRLIGFVLASVFAASEWGVADDRNLYAASQGVIRQQRRSYYFWTPTSETVSNGEAASPGGVEGSPDEENERKLQSRLRGDAGSIRQEITLLPPPVNVRSLPSPVPNAANRRIWVEAARSAARKYRIDESVFLRLVHHESGFNPNARSRVGALGLAQLMPGTARQLGVNPFNPMENLDGGARYFSQMLRRFNGDYVSALAAYNAGPVAVEAYQQGEPRYSGGKWINRRGIRSTIPPYRETINYVRSILGLNGSALPAVGRLSSQSPVAASPSPSGIDLGRLNMDQPLSAPSSPSPAPQPQPVLRSLGTIEIKKRPVRSFYIFEN